MRSIFNWGEAYLTGAGQLFVCVCLHLIKWVDEGKPFVITCPDTEVKKAYDRLRDSVLDATKNYDKKKSSSG